MFAWGGDISFLWVPSHCKVTGNDEANTLAEKGTKLSQVGVPVTHATAKAPVRAAPEQTSSEGSVVGEADAAAEATTTTGS